jgi:photosystem II stability/assembly factor-like uncharacterized protein
MPANAPTNNNWRSVASSADGTKLVAVSSPFGEPGVICASTNAGATWTQTCAPSNVWFTVASSADGIRLVAAVGFSTSGPIYTSADSGATWTLTSAPTNNWLSVASSADGTRLAAAGTQIKAIYTSVDAGNTWTTNNLPALNWESVAGSADGTKLAAVSPSPGGGIFLSTNWGTNWTHANGYTAFPASRAIACSADGARLAVVDGLLTPTAIYVSTNFGTSWATNALASHFGQSTWSAIASSAAGTRLVAIVGYIYTSVDSGATWQTNNLSDEGWGGAAASADGCQLIVLSAGTASGPGNIYLSQTTPSPVLNSASSNNNLGLSWIVPSMNFVLQQNSDLLTTNWTMVTDTPVLNLTNLQNQVFLSPTGGSSFYRLATP